MKLEFSLVGFLLSIGLAHGDSRVRGRRLEESIDEGETCQENGYEVWQQQPNANVGLKLDTEVNADTCQYRLTLSWEPDEVSAVQSAFCRMCALFLLFPPF